MCMAKALDDRMHILLVKQGPRPPFVGSSRGHEGIQVASTAVLVLPDDWLRCPQLPRACQLDSCAG